nr:immunoglobulin heavy chain junction region [Macaca mulatta]
CVRGQWSGRFDVW